MAQDVVKTKDCGAFSRVKWAVLATLASAFIACGSETTGRNADGSPHVDGRPDGGAAHDDNDAPPDGGHAALDGALPESDGQVPQPVPDEDAPNRALTFEGTDEIFLNPERGFYMTTRLTNPTNIRDARKNGKTLVYAAVHLQDYLPENHEQDLPASLLDDIRAGFAKVREAGVKAIVRFQYDDGEGYPGGANDASEVFMKRHIEQVAPVLQENEDVLFLLQAGFIGAWGEWHTSQNFVDGPGGKEARARVFDALLSAAPKSRRVALRYPAYKRMFVGADPTSFADLTEENARARAAHLNDCFLSSEDDVGTYQYEPMEILKAYLEEDTRYVPIGGETCALHDRTACDVATAEMARFHWTYINDEYHQDVLARWRTQGCRDDIERKLGYRFTLTRGALPYAVRPGGSFLLDLTLVNQGYAAPTNPRPVLVVLSGEAKTLTAELPVDVRTFLPGEHKIRARLRLPHDLAPQTYRLALWLPDAAEGLRTRPEYAVRFANQDMWNESDGTNTLGQLTVRDDAEGSSDPSAAAFTVIP